MTNTAPRANRIRIRQLCCAVLITTPELTMSQYHACGELLRAEWDKWDFAFGGSTRQAIILGSIVCVRPEQNYICCPSTCECADALATSWCVRIFCFTAEATVRLVIKDQRLVNHQLHDTCVTVPYSVNCNAEYLGTILAVVANKVNMKLLA